MPETQKTPTAKQPADHLKKASAEARQAPITFDWDGEAWEVDPRASGSLEFLAALEDDLLIAALRILLGRDQAARLIKGRHADDLDAFFEAAGEATGSGNS